MLCFLSELLQHPREAGHPPFPRWEECCCWGLAHQIPEMLPKEKQQHPPSLCPTKQCWSSAMTMPSQRSDCRALWGTQLCSAPTARDAQLLLWLLTASLPRRESPEGNAAAELLPMAMLWKEVVVTRWHWESDTADYPRTISKWLAVIRSRWQWVSRITVIYTEKINKCYMPLATGMDRHCRYAAAMMSMTRMVQVLS